MAIRVDNVLRALQELAPPVLAESWDNVGLLLGSGGQSVTRVVVALDATAPVLQQAAAANAELLVTHHPLIFSSLKRLVEDGGVTTLMRQLVREDRSLIAMHTNLDSAPGGLNHYVGTLFGLRALRPLLPSAAHPLIKIVVYVPETHVEAVRAAICRAGAGQIGRYSECTFGVEGTGTFRPGAGTQPFIGELGTLEFVREVRLETVAPRAALGAVLAALLAAHPYEEVAYDLFPLENAWPGAGIGRIGVLETSTTAGEFCRRVQAVLKTERVMLSGDPQRAVRKVALCTGSGGEYADAARRAGADLYLTGEIKHHTALLARGYDLPMIDAGHFATERPAVDLLAGFLEERFPDVTVVRAEECDPFAYRLG